MSLIPYLTVHWLYCVESDKIAIWSTRKRGRWMDYFSIAWKVGGGPRLLGTPETNELISVECTSQSAQGPYPPPPPPTFPPFQPTRPLENYVRIFFFSARQCGIFPIRFHLSQQQQQSILFCSPQSVFNIIMTHTPAVALVTQSPILLNQWYIYKSKSRFIWSNTGCTMWGPGVVIINPFSACRYRRQLSKPSNMTRTI